MKRIFTVTLGGGLVCLVGLIGLAEPGWANSPASSDALLAQGQQWLVNGQLGAQWGTPNAGADLARAKATLLEAQRQAPERPAIWSALGRVYTADGDLEAALNAYEQILRQEPLNASALLGMAELASARQAYANARDWLMQAGERDPNDPAVLMGMARLLSLTGHAQEALTMAQRAEKLRPAFDPLREGLIAQTAEQLGDAKLAFYHYQQLQRRLPSSAVLAAKLADLAPLAGQSPAQVAALQSQAFRLDPNALPRRVSALQDLLRQERTLEALTAARNLMDAIGRMPLPEETRASLAHAIASAHYLDWTLGQPRPEDARADMKRLAVWFQGPSAPLLQLDGLKLRIAADVPANSPLTPEIKDALTTLALHPNDDLAAGEALFLLGRYKAAQERWDAVDGQTGEGYAAIGDRLLAEQALVMARTHYQRGLGLEKRPEITAGLALLQRKQNLAEQRIRDGNTLFEKKQYAQALIPYQQAAQIYPEWETPYLRIGDTYERLRDKYRAHQAYQNAVELLPALLDSQDFAKKLKKLSRATPTTAKR